MRILAQWIACVVLLTAGGAAVAVDPQDPCAHFAWNVSRELALFASKASNASAGRDKTQAPLIPAGQLYELSLSPQGQVTFPMAPAKKGLADGAYAGLVQVSIPSAGLYRVSLDGPFWIDVIAEGKLLASTDFTGNHECKSLRKLVEFQLPAGKVLVQLTGAPRDRVRLTVTPSPPKS